MSAFDDAIKALKRDRRAKEAKPISRAQTPVLPAKPSGAAEAPATTPNGPGAIERQPGHPNLLRGRRDGGIAKAIRERTDSGLEMVDFMLSTMRGEMTEERAYQRRDGDIVTAVAPVPHRDRMAAAQWLTDRGFGKTPEVLRTESVKLEARILRFEGMSTAQQMAWAALAAALPVEEADVVDVEAEAVEPGDGDP